MELLLGWAYNVCRDGASSRGQWLPLHGTLATNIEPFREEFASNGFERASERRRWRKLKNGYLQNLRSRPPMCRHRTQGRKLGSLGAARDTEVLRVSLSPFLLCPFEGSDALDGLGEAGDNACRAPTRAEPSSVRVNCMERRTYFPSFRNPMHCLATRENDRNSHQHT